MLFQDSVAAEFKALDRELFTNFVQAGHTKILAFQQVIAGATDQLANGGEPQADHTLTCPHRKVEIGDGDVRA